MQRFRTTRRARTNLERPVPVLTKGFAVIALLLAVGWFATQSINGVPGKEYASAFVEVPEKGSIIQHDPVRIAGVQVGQVLSVAGLPKGGARIELQLEKGTTLPVDSEVSIRANGLLGARYVQLISGRSRTMLADGATIRGKADALTSGLAETLDVFDAKTRAGFGSMFDGLGEGFAGNGRRLNRTIPVSADAQGRFQSVIRELLRRPGSVEAFLPSLNDGMRPLDQERETMAAGFAPTRDALQPFVDRRAAVRRTFELAPSTLAAADAGLQDGRRLLGAARELSASASRTLPSAPASLRATSRLLEESDRPLRRTQALLRQVPGVVDPTLRTTARLRPLLPKLDGLFADLTPISTLTGRYGCDLVNFGIVFRSMTGFGGFGEGPGGPAMQFRLQSVAQAPEQLRTYARDGYPAPCKYLGGVYPQSNPVGAGG